MLISICKKSGLQLLTNSMNKLLYKEMYSKFGTEILKVKYLESQNRILT
jgi:hypothetical protein